MAEKVESSLLVKRSFPAIYKSNCRYYIYAVEDTNILYVEEHEIEKLNDTDEHIKTIRIFCTHGTEIKLLREWERGTSIFTSIFTP